MNGSIRLSKRTNLLVRFSVTALALSVITISCTTNQKQPAAVNPDLNRARSAEKQSQANKVEQRILEEYRRWKGTRHRLGGTGSQGIDCSGFVKAVYKDVFNINLPRTTKAQVRQGKSVSFNELQPGDRAAGSGYAFHPPMILQNSRRNEDFFRHQSRSPVFPA